MDSAKAQEFLDKHGELIMNALISTFSDFQEGHDEAEQKGWHALRRSMQQAMDETQAAMRDLELLRGEE